MGQLIRKLCVPPQHKMQAQSTNIDTVTGFSNVTALLTYIAHKLVRCEYTVKHAAADIAPAACKKQLISTLHDLVLLACYECIGIVMISS